MITLTIETRLWTSSSAFNAESPDISRNMPVVVTQTLPKPLVGLEM
jgi:hypothetical protein